MGYETYCLACGCPTSNNLSNVSLFVDQLKECIKKCKDKRIENQWQVENIFYELLEQNIIDQEEHDHLSEKDNLLFLDKDKKYNWLSELYLLHKNGDVIPVKPKDSWDGIYTDANGYAYDASYVLNEYQNLSDKKEIINIYDPFSTDFCGDGFIIHKDCYQLVNDRLSNFNFNNICLQKINYNEIYPYMLQEMPWMKYFLNNKQYFLESPLNNNKNKQRIINIIDSMKFI
jgi:hypothetical protein